MLVMPSCSSDGRAQTVHDRTLESLSRVAAARKSISLWEESTGMQVDPYKRAIRRPARLTLTDFSDQRNNKEDLGGLRPFEVFVMDRGREGGSSGR
jgi:hypothetical protein